MEARSLLIETAAGIGLSVAALQPDDLARMTDPAFSLSLSGEDIRRTGARTRAVAADDSFSVDQDRPRVGNRGHNDRNLSDDWEAGGGRAANGEARSAAAAADDDFAFDGSEVRPRF